MKKRFKNLLVLSSVFLLSATATLTAQAKWERDAVGWWYSTENGSYKSNCWFQDTDMTWYHFNESGYITTGWFSYDNKWYYFDGNGKMLYSQWIHDNNKDYYLSNNGSMLTNTTTPDGYKVNASGEWVRNTTTSGIISTTINNISIEHPEYFLNEAGYDTDNSVKSKVYIKNSYIVGNTIFLEFEDTYDKYQYWTMLHLDITYTNTTNNTTRKGSLRVAYISTDPANMKLYEINLTKNYDKITLTQSNTYLD